LTYRYLFVLTPHALPTRPEEFHSRLSLGCVEGVAMRAAAVALPIDARRHKSLKDRWISGLALLEEAQDPTQAPQKYFPMRYRREAPRQKESRDIRVPAQFHSFTMTNSEPNSGSSFDFGFGFEFRFDVLQ
jgi:hypothetical protein